MINEILSIFKKVKVYKWIKKLLVRLLQAECNDLLDQITDRLETAWQNLTMSPTHSLSSEGSNLVRPPLSLIIDGKTLAFALETPLDKKFVAIAKRCETVICCRAAPLQKVSKTAFRALSYTYNGVLSENCERLKAINHFAKVDIVNGW